MWEPMSAITPAPPRARWWRQAKGSFRVELAVVEVGHAPVPDLTEVTLVDEAPEVAQRGREPKGERDHVDPARVAVGSLRQARAPGWVRASGFSQRTCLPAASAAPATGPVEVTGRADDDGVELGIGDQGLPGVVHAGDTPLLGEGLGLRRVPRRDRRHLGEVGEQSAGSGRARRRRCAPCRSGPLGSAAAVIRRSPADAYPFGSSQARRPLRGRARERLARFPRPQEGGTIAASSALMAA